MNSNTKNITNNSFMDKVLIVFPFWFPLSYLILINNYPTFSKIIFIGTLFLFAETHFASTWLFFFDKENLKWIKKNSYNFIFLPIYFSTLIVLVWFFNSSLIILLHYLASGWHVTKQSIGILKLYKTHTKLKSFLVYFVSFFCLIFGLGNPGIISTNFSTNEINIFLLVFGFIYLIVLLMNFLKTKERLFNSSLPIITGLFIYVPILFFENLAIATVIGVGMHWIQYITIMWSTNLRKEKLNLSRGENVKNKKIKNNVSKIIFIFTYSFVMTMFAIKGMPEISIKKTEYSFFYLIPLVFQMYHFYIDGFIWRFSDKHIKHSVAPYLYSMQ